MEYREQPQSSNEMMIFNNTYIFVKTDSSINIYDQHALHERILYEKFKNALKGKELSVQPLLIPEEIEVSEEDKDILVHILPTLKTIGFDLTQTANRTFIITAIPSDIKKANLTKILLEFVEDFKDKGMFKESTNDEERALSIMACRGAIKAGDKIDKVEAISLINQLNTMNKNTGLYGYTCPHGRPLRIELTENELQKMFKRIV